tara:strand:- start:690 stop:1313 length:624 start_codon:yes stop_codon:yes gene_type:complete
MKGEFNVGALVLLIVGGIVVGACVRFQSTLLMWAAGFQLVFSVYLSVMLCETVVTVVHAIVGEGSDPYYDATALLLLCLIFFLLMFVVTRQLFPQLDELRLLGSLDQAGAVILGFASGVLLTSFLMFLLCTTPLADNSFVRLISGKSDPAAESEFPLRVACKSVSYLSFQSDPESYDNRMTELTKLQSRGAESPEKTELPAMSRPAE